MEEGGPFDEISKEEGDDPVLARSKASERAPQQMSGHPAYVGQQRIASTVIHDEIAAPGVEPVSGNTTEGRLGPVIGINWGGVAQYASTDCALLVDPTSQEAVVAGLTSAMRRMVQSPLLRQSMGTAARRHLEQARHGWADKADDTLNHAYFPVRVTEEYAVSSDILCRELQSVGIMARRYFHPLICDMPGYRDLPSARQALPVARRIARQILCLPIHANLSDEQVERAVGILARA